VGIEDEVSSKITGVARIQTSEKNYAGKIQDYS